MVQMLRKQAKQENSELKANFDMNISNQTSMIQKQQAETAELRSKLLELMKKIK